MRLQAVQPVDFQELLADLERYEAKPSGINAARLNDHYQNLFWSAKKSELLRAVGPTRSVRQRTKPRKDEFPTKVGKLNPRTSLISRMRSTPLRSVLASSRESDAVQVGLQRHRSWRVGCHRPTPVRAHLALVGLLTSRRETAAPSRCPGPIKGNNNGRIRIQRFPAHAWLQRAGPSRIFTGVPCLSVAQAGTNRPPVQRWR